MATAGGRISTGLGVSLLTTTADRNPDATVFVGNLDAATTEPLLWELAGQAGPVASVYMPADRVTGGHQGYAFVEYRSDADADYAIKILNMVRLHGKPLRVNKSAADKATADVGANIFVGNLDPDADEKALHDTFSAFGVVIDAPHIARDPDTGVSKGFGFVSYDCFEAADAAIAAMDGQFFAGRTIAVQYAFKKGGARGERHGTPAERLLADQFRAKGAGARPHTRFAAEYGGRIGGGDDSVPPPPPPDVPPPPPPGGPPVPPPPPPGGQWGGQWGVPPPPPPPPPYGGFGGVPPQFGGVPPPPPPGWGGAGPPPPPPPPGWGGPPAGWGVPPPPPPPQ